MWFTITLGKMARFSVHSCESAGTCSCWGHTVGVLMIKAVGLCLHCSVSVLVTEWESSAQRWSRKRLGWRWLFMLVALTRFLIDLCREWSVNTAEQTCNGTINQGLECRTTLYQGRVCAEPWRGSNACVWMIARCPVSPHVPPLCCTWMHTHTLGPLTLVIKQSSCEKEQFSSLCVMEGI